MYKPVFIFGPIFEGKGKLHLPFKWLIFKEGGLFPHFMASANSKVRHSSLVGQGKTLD